MYKDSYRHRKKYYVTLFVSIYVLIFLISTLIIAANWKYVKKIFEPQQRELSVEQLQFNELSMKVKYLEDLSKQYNENNYQLRTVIYIRSAQYPDSQWGDLLGYNDENFVTYVEKNEGGKKVSSLRSMGSEYCFVNPKTKQKVDFYRLFANINALYIGNQDCIDYISWGGYICQNALTFKDSSSESLKEDIKMQMQSQNQFDMLQADCDAVNIYNRLENDYFVNNSLYLSFILYYAAFDKNAQTNDFINSIGFEKPTSVMKRQIYVRLQNNPYIQLICNNGGVDFPQGVYNPLLTDQSKIYIAAINAYVELLGI